MSPTGPSPRALLVGIAVAGTAAAAGLGANGPRVPNGPADTLTWWADVGTPRAAMALVHLAAMGAALWLVVVAAVGLVALGRPHPIALTLWRRLSPPTLRRLMGGGLALAATATITPVGADDAPVVVDLGPVDDEPIVLVDLGPVDAPQPDTVVPAYELRPDVVVGSAPVDTWTVARGDHLWHIAEETLRDRGEPVTEREVSRYWRRLIDANRDVVGDDPDLVHPGEVIRLPD